MQRDKIYTKDIETIPFVDENSNTFFATDKNRENVEQYIASNFIHPNDCIIELGARYGTVSCIANHILSNPFNHVVVEPDKRVIYALNVNRGIHDCYFFIFDGIVSKNKKYSLTNLTNCKGYGTTSIENNKSKIPILSLDQLEKVVFKPFNCLIADCEGFLETFIDENPSILKTYRLITFEKDGNCNYEKIERLLKENNYEMIFEWNKSHFVYKKKYI